jgi:hypothetical protein
VNPEHLFLGTQADNMRDMAAKGRSPLGKLSPQDVLAVRYLRAQGATLHAIGEIFGVADNTVLYAVNGRNWKGIP